MRRIQLCVLVVVLLLISVLQPVQASGPGQVVPTPADGQTTPADRCEPNNNPDQPCVLLLDRVNGPFTFLPIGDQDYYSVDLGAQPAMSALQVTIRATAGLDLLTTLTQAGEQTPLALISSPAISTTLPASLTGWLLIRVENRAAAIPTGESYAIELRALTPVSPTATVQGALPAVAAPDALENNWSSDSAAPIAIGVVYDLTFACPVFWPGACPGGDHDYLRAPVKAGLRYRVAAYDLSPGVDPVLELFWDQQTSPVRANDDAFTGGFASMIDWVAPANGDLIIRVSPRNGNQQPALPGASGTSSTTSTRQPLGGYHMTIALAQSDLAQTVLAQVAAAANVSLPSAQHPASGSSSIPPASVATPATDGLQGQAIVVDPQGAMLRDGPSTTAASIQTLPAEAIVTTLGQVSGAWVRVQPVDGVVPGWVYGPQLKPFYPDASPTPAPERPTPGQPSAPEVDPTAQMPTAIPALQVVRLADRPPAPVPTSLPRQPLTIQVVVESALQPRQTPARGPTATPAAVRPLAGVRVQLVTVFGEVLTEAITPSSGSIVFTRDVGPQTALLLHIPAAGLVVPIDPQQPNLTITLPRGA